mgnify:CR=1 FL=1
MSLINQMLRDLDKRHALDDPQAPALEHVRRLDHVVVDADDLGQLHHDLRGCTRT